jgi:hypothetical protein
MSFLCILHESPLQQSGLAPSSFIAEHESPLQQHDSIAQHASPFFF